MLMSHQSSINDCDNYIKFLSLTYNAPTGRDVPLIKDILVNGGKYYGECLFNNKKPGTYF